MTADPAGLAIMLSGQPMEGGIGSQRAFRVPPYLGVGSAGGAGVGSAGGAGVGSAGGAGAGSAHPIKTPPTAIIMISKTRNNLFITFYLLLVTGKVLIYSNTISLGGIQNVMIIGQFNRLAILPTSRFIY